MAPPLDSLRNVPSCEASVIKSGLLRTLKFGYPAYRTFLSPKTGCSTLCYAPWRPHQHLVPRANAVAVCTELAECVDWGACTPRRCPRGGNTRVHLGVSFRRILASFSNLRAGALCAGRSGATTSSLVSLPCASATKSGTRRFAVTSPGVTATKTTAELHAISRRAKGWLTKH